MTPEQEEMLHEIHAYWFRAAPDGQPSRATRFDILLKHYDNGKFAIRALFWLGAFLAAVATAWDKVRLFVIAMLGGGT